MNPMPAAKELTPRQRTVLQWVVDGCPTEPEVPSTYKTTARSLEGHGLVKVKGHGKTWRATVTERGKNVLAGKEPLRKPKRGQEEVYNPLPPPPKPPEDHVTETQIAELADALAAELNASADGWTSRNVTEEYRKNVLFPAVRLLRAPKKDLLDKKDKLVAKSDFTYREPKFCGVFFFDGDEWLTADPESVIAGTKAVRKYHPVVNEYAKYVQASNKEVLGRIKRVLHVVLTEAEARGWEVTTEFKRAHRIRHKDRLDIAVSGCSWRPLEVVVKEINNVVERPPTQEEVEDHARAWNRDYPIRKFYDHIPTGLVEVSVGTYTRKDTHSKPKRLDTAVPAIFASISEEARWSEVKVAASQIAARRREKWLAKATELARAHHRESERYKTLLKRAEEWKELQVVQEYLDALEGVPEAAEWLAWCRGYLGDTGLLGDTHLPMNTPFDINENRRLIESFEQQLPEDESLW